MFVGILFACFCCCAWTDRDRSHTQVSCAERECVRVSEHCCRKRKTFVFMITFLRFCVVCSFRLRFCGGPIVQGKKIVTQGGPGRMGKLSREAGAWRGILCVPQVALSLEKVVFSLFPYFFSLHCMVVLEQKKRTCFFLCGGVCKVLFIFSCET